MYGGERGDHGEWNNGGEEGEPSTSWWELWIEGGWATWRMPSVGSEMEDGVIIRGSMDMASTSAAAAGLGRECLDCVLGPEEEREASMIVFTLLRRRMIKNVARRRTIRRRTAPPIMPPSWGVVRPPLLEVLLAFVLAIAASGIEVSFGTRPVAPVVAIPVGACGAMAVVNVFVRVCATPASVVVVVSVNVRVTISVEKQLPIPHPIPFLQHP